MSVFQRRRVYAPLRQNPNLAPDEEGSQNNLGNGNDNGTGDVPGTPTGTAGTGTTALPPPTLLARRNTNDNMFPPGGVRNVNASTNAEGKQPSPSGAPERAINHDSLTLGQLKAAAAAGLPKEKVSHSFPAGSDMLILVAKAIRLPIR
jgi:hypothetical protein